jgi:hypothetical protein
LLQFYSEQIATSHTVGRLWPKCIDPVEQASTIVVQVAVRPNRTGDALRWIVEPGSST